MIDRQFAGLAAHFAGTDDVAAGQLATEYLILQGCRRIVHIRGPQVSTGLGRLEGYRLALSAADGGPLPESVISAGASEDHRGEVGGYHAAQQLLDREQRPEGIFCFNDPIAMGVMQAVLDRGLQILADIAVVGCGNVLYSAFLRVPLTTIDQNSEQIGIEAGELALSLVEKRRSGPPELRIASPKLLVRASSRSLVEEHTS